MIGRGIWFFWNHLNVINCYIYTILLKLPLLLLSISFPFWLYFNFMFKKTTKIESNSYGPLHYSNGPSNHQWIWKTSLKRKFSIQLSCSESVSTSHHHGCKDFWFLNEKSIKHTTEMILWSMILIWYLQTARLLFILFCLSSFENIQIPQEHRLELHLFSKICRESKMYSFKKYSTTKVLRT